MNMPNSAPRDWLSIIVDGEKDAIIVIDTERIIRFANKAAMELGARSGALNIVGENYDAILRKSLILEEKDNVASPYMYPSAITLGEGKPVEDAIFQKRVQGTSAWIRASSLPVLDEHAQISHMIVRFADISAQKSQEDKLKFLIASSKILPMAADLHDRLTEEARLIVPLLADWCQVNLVREDGSITQVITVHRDPQNMSEVEKLDADTILDSREAVEHVVTTGIAEFYPDISEEFLATTAHSPQRFAIARKLGLTSYMILPVISNEKILVVLSLAYAESKRTYSDDDFAFMQEYFSHISMLLENARLYEEIKKRDISKDEFLATLSHELRNPLAPIKSMLELMKMQPHAGEFKHIIEIIEHQFNHLTKILTDLLEVNRYARGKVHIELRRVNLITVMRNSVESAEIFFNDKNIELEVSLPPHAIVIRADQTRLEQALMNVLHNAEKFTPIGGRIWVRVTTDEKTASIIIGDNGVGIEPQMLEHIFEPGRRGESVQGKTDGLGLGLVLVKEIVQLHGGTIKARSEGLGKGSEFIITLPVLQQRLL